jgi:hypothetical protein
MVVMKSINVVGSILLMIAMAGVLTACGGNTQTPSLTSTPTVVITTPLSAQSGGQQVGGEVAIAWTAISGATSYNIYWSTNPAVTTTTGTRITGATSPYVHTGLTNGTTYYYLVTSESSSGESAPGGAVSATPSVSPSPEGVTATAGSNQVTVNWQAVSGAASYNVYVSTIPGFTPGTAAANKIPIPSQSSSYIDKGLQNGTTYFYVVTAVNSGGESAPSKQARAQPSILSIPYMAAKVLSLAGGGTPPWGWLAQVGVYTDNTQQTPIANAGVTVNGTALAYNAADGHYEGNVAVAAGATVTVAVTINSVTYEAVGTQYTAPAISSSVSGMIWQHINDNTVTWTPGAPITSNASYFIGVTDSSGNFVYPASNGNGGPLEIPLTYSSWDVAANSLNAGKYNVVLEIGTSGLADNAAANIPFPNAAPGSGLWLGALSIVPVTAQ